MCLTDGRRFTIKQMMALNSTVHLIFIFCAYTKKPTKKKIDYLLMLLFVASTWGHSTTTAVAITAQVTTVMALILATIVTTVTAAVEAAQSTCFLQFQLHVLYIQRNEPEKQQHTANTNKKYCKEQQHISLKSTLARIHNSIRSIFFAFCCSLFVPKCLLFTSMLIFFSSCFSSALLFSRVHHHFYFTYIFSSTFILIFCSI